MGLQTTARSATNLPAIHPTPFEEIRAGGNPPAGPPTLFHSLKLKVFRATEKVILDWAAARYFREEIPGAGAARHRRRPRMQPEKEAMNFCRPRQPDPAAVFRLRRAGIYIRRCIKRSRSKAWMSCSFFSIAP